MQYIRRKGKVSVLLTGCLTIGWPIPPSLPCRACWGAKSFWFIYQILRLWRAVSVTGLPAHSATGWASPATHMESLHFSAHERNFGCYTWCRDVLARRWWTEGFHISRNRLKAHINNCKCNKICHSFALRRGNTDNTKPHSSRRIPVT